MKPPSDRFRPITRVLKERSSSPLTRIAITLAPCLSLASTYWLAWRAQGSKVEDKTWMKIPIAFDHASAPPRNPLVSALHAERANWIGYLLNEIGPRLSPVELMKYRAKIVEANQSATRINPTAPCSTPAWRNRAPTFQCSRTLRPRAKKRSGSTGSILTPTRSSPKLAGGGSRA